jgi:hypothetical protein
MVNKYLFSYRNRHLTCVIEQLPLNSTVYSIDASAGDTIYIGGEFLCLNASGGYRNIVSYDYLSGRMISLNSSGLNGKVSKLISYKQSSKKTCNVKKYHQILTLLFLIRTVCRR